MSTTRVRKPKARNDNARMDFRTCTRVKEKIEWAASLQGVSVSDFVLGNATRAAQEIIERETRIELGEAASLQVAEALARPGRVRTEILDLFSS